MRIPALLWSAALVVAPAFAQKHAHFDDGGALEWHTRLDAAKAAAKRSSKLILIEYGREA